MILVSHDDEAVERLCTRAVARSRTHRDGRHRRECAASHRAPPPFRKGEHASQPTQSSDLPPVKNAVAHLDRY